MESLSAFQIIINELTFTLFEAFSFSENKLRSEQYITKAIIDKEIVNLWTVIIAFEYKSLQSLQALTFEEYSSFSKYANKLYDYYIKQYQLLLPVENDGNSDRVFYMN